MILEGFFDNGIYRFDQLSLSEALKMHENHWCSDMKALEDLTVTCRGRTAILAKVPAEKAIAWVMNNEDQKKFIIENEEKENSLRLVAIADNVVVLSLINGWSVSQHNKPQLTFLVNERFFLW